MNPTEPPIPSVTLPGGETVPALGLGTWNMAERRQNRAEEIAALQSGIDLGMTVIDTAEMYADGGSESLVGEAIADRRSRVFLVSKVLPQNSSRDGTIAACEASLRRLRTDRLDLYLLHWRGRVPLDDTLAGFEQLHRDGKIRHWGVSNFDVDDMVDLLARPRGRGEACASNQVLYNLNRRGIEFDLLPLCRQHGMPVMAYSPIEQGRMLRNSELGKVAKAVGATPAQVALAWLLRQDGVISIPKATSLAHLREDIAALDLQLDKAALKALDRAFPPPTRHAPLAML